jgi:hypothetical protein
MKTCLLCLTLLLIIFTAEAQEQTVLIHIKLINSRTEKPMKHEQVGLEDRASYRELSAALMNSASRRSTLWETR